LSNPIPDFTSPEFIRALKEKTAIAAFAPRTRWSGGKQIPDEIIYDPIFSVIAYVQRHEHRMNGAEERSIKEMVEAVEATQEPSSLEAAFARVRENLRDFYRKEYNDLPSLLLGQEWVMAAALNDHARQEWLSDLTSLHYDKAFGPLDDGKRHLYPWRYYIGSAACMFLQARIIPTKKDVKEAAIRHRAVLEAAQSGKVVFDIGREMERLTKEFPLNARFWRKDFNELGLKDLPSASRRR
jgi:hypothetical protein